MNNHSQQKWLLDAVNEVCDRLESVEDGDKLTATFVNSLSELFNVDKVSFMLLDEIKGELSIKAFQGLNPEAAAGKVKLGESFSGRVAQEGKPLLVKNVENEYPGLRKGRLSHYSSNSFVIVPVKSGEKTIGVVSLTDRKDKELFNEYDVKALYLAGSYFALLAERNKLLKRNKEISILDPLTNLFNHSYFHEQLLEEIYRAERYKRPLSIIITNIDNFSDYNRGHGHAAGDNVLKQISKIIRENVRQADMVCRYSGEEFSVILPETKLKEAIFVAEKINERIRGAVFTETNSKKSFLGIQRLTASVGITEHRVGLTKEELIQHAVSAVREAKQKGKNCVSAYK